MGKGGKWTGLRGLRFEAPAPEDDPISSAGRNYLRDRIRKAG